jgi:hypothetical protein
LLRESAVLPQVIAPASPNLAQPDKNSIKAPAKGRLIDRDQWRRKCLPLGAPMAMHQGIVRGDIERRPSASLARCDD